MVARAGAGSGREHREGWQIAQHGENQRDDQQWPEKFGREKFAGRLSTVFFRQKSPATNGHGHQAQNEQCIVMHGGGESSVEQGVKRPRRTAAGTVPARQFMKGADRIKSVRRRIEEKNHRPDAQRGGA